MAEIIINGNVVDKAECGFTKDERAYAHFTIGYNSKKGENSTAIFYRVTAFDENAALCADEKFIAKGKFVSVEGSYDEAEVEKDGKKYINRNIILKRLGFISKKNKSTENN